MLTIASSAIWITRPALAVPANLVGVWAGKEAVFRGPIVIDGIALYLKGDGDGWIVGGSIERNTLLGGPIRALFDAADNILKVDQIDPQRKVAFRHMSIAYRPSTESLYSTQLFNEGVTPYPLYRKFPDVPSDMRKYMGI